MDQKTIENHIKYCLYLAKLGIGQVSPNPPVGALLVCNNKIIGEGYHKKFGEAHAEVNAISNVADDQKYLIKDSCLFVSLEPCQHQGKTPPCTELILKHGIKKLVFGCYDPNPNMSGKSIEYLKQQGLDVIGPVLETDCKNNIREFTLNVTWQRPYIILKFAQSADFFIGLTNQKTKISTATTDILVHRWRSEVDAILVGSNTIKVDNPKLTTRLWPGKNPIRIALGRFSSNEKMTFEIFNNEATTQLASDLLPDTKYSLEEIVHELYKNDIGILLIEGGAKTINSFYQAGLWDEARVITRSNLWLKAGIPAPSIQGQLENSNILDKEVIHYIRKYQ